MKQTEPIQAIEPRVAAYMDDATRRLKSGTIRSMRLTPLLLQQSFPDLVSRRKRLFLESPVERTEFGFRVNFRRELRPTAQFPQGRIVGGSFDVLQLSDQLSLMASSLPPDPHNHGPALLTERAYPLAKQPFIHSGGLVALVDAMAAENDWTPVATDSMGYDRRTLKFRRDYKRQSVDDAFREMREQDRHLHQVRVSFRGGNGRREALVASLNRYGEVVVHRGSVRVTVEQFVLPAVDRVMTEASSYAIERATQPSNQEVLQLKFSAQLFTDPDDMAALCQAVRRGAGLSVSTVHLNPYLQAQVLDFFTGAAVELLVMDESTISLIPRAGRCRSSLERIAETIFCFFGEAELKRSNVRAT